MSDQVISKLQDLELQDPVLQRILDSSTRRYNLTDGIPLGYENIPRDVERDPPNEALAFNESDGQPSSAIQSPIKPSKSWVTSWPTRGRFL